MSCAFEPCDAVLGRGEACAMVGGCVNRRFGDAGASASSSDPKRKSALNGTAPRASRDPVWTKRSRKVIQ